MQGGGILFQNGTQETLRVANTVFVNNRATTGGALFGQDCAQAIYYNNVFVNNTASGSGGAIFLVQLCYAIVSLQMDGVACKRIQSQ